MSQRGEKKREHPAKQRGGYTAPRVESATPSFVDWQARSGGQREGLKIYNNRSRGEKRKEEEGGGKGLKI